MYVLGKKEIEMKKQHNCEHIKSEIQKEWNLKENEYTLFEKEFSIHGKSRAQEKKDVIILIKVDR